MIDRTTAAAQFVDGASALAADQPARALAAFDGALALAPDFAKAHAGRGMALGNLGDDAGAIDALCRAVAIDPRGALPVLVDLGYQFLQRGRLSSSHTAFTRLLDLHPDHLPARQGRVVALLVMNRHEEALPHLTALQAAMPDMDYLAGLAFHARLQCCDWSDYDTTQASITDRVRRGERADAPLTFIVHSTRAADQKQCAATFVAHRCVASSDGMRRAGASSGSRVRVAYLSSDLRDHAVAQLMAGVFESHDRLRFEVYGLSCGPGDGSALRRRIEAALEHWVDVAAWSDEAIAQWIVQHAIDILVDLGGHSCGGRTRVLAFRPAPVQIGMLGYPGTLGTDYVDYLVADEGVIPPASRVHYSEQPLYLPDTFLPADRPGSPGPVATRLAEGLPAAAFVFCCFNALYKISPHVYACWMRILDAVPGSVLWLREGSPSARRNLKIEAAHRGMDPSRLRFAARTATRVEHQARFALADLFLDTAPYGAHATAVDSLAAGVPILTLRGEPFASRVAASLLETVGLSELVVDSVERYERLAVALAHDPARIAQLKDRLRGARTTAPLFDPGRYCRHLETAYVETMARHRRNEPPSPLVIEGSAAIDSSLAPCADPWHRQPLG